MVGAPRLSGIVLALNLYATSLCHDTPKVGRQVRLIVVPCGLRNVR
jgi:hypothetical protein